MTELKKTTHKKNSKRDGRKKLMTAHGKTMSRIEWARHLGISGTALDGRLKRHSVEEALSEDFCSGCGRRTKKQPDSNGAGGQMKILTAFGKTMPRIAWARHLGITCGAIDYRLRHHPVEIALSRDFKRIVVNALKKRGMWHNKRNVTSEKSLANLRKNLKKASLASMKNAKRYTFRGETHTVSEWAEKLGVEYHTLYMRLRAFPPEEALATPSLKHLAGIPRSKR